MEILDEYQEHPCAVAAGQSDVTGTTAAAAAAAAVVVANMASIAVGMGHHRHNSESPMSHQEEDLSDPDRQDEESGEELPQQPLQGTSHSSAENTPVQTPLAHLNSLMSQQHPHFMAKIKLEQNHEQELLGTKSGIEALQAAISSGGFSLPFSFPPPPNFLNPNAHGNPLLGQPGRDGSSGSVGNSSFINSAGGSNHNNGSNNNGGSSASSHTSESSQSSGKNGLEITSLRDSGIGAGGGGGGNSGHGQSSSQGGSQGQQQHQQQTSWSFEEQFKQLYEINDDPKRKEFLDDLFSFMQKRGSPINRLPIMAKSVLDLYELYNLVIARGGLVDVINKKLWQEIIKGLHLPSSITSAAFTLRTQYMKYLYPYECEKKHLSTPMELQAAIDGNRREGRRSNYGAYGGGGPDSAMQRSSHTPSSLASLAHQMSPLSLVSTLAAAGATGGGQHQVNPQALVNGSAVHTPMPHHPHHPQHQQPGLGQTPSAGISPDFEARMAEYVKQLHRGINPQHVQQLQQQQQLQQDRGSPPSQSNSPNQHDNALFEMSRLTLLSSIYNNNLHPSFAAAAAAANVAGYNHTALSPRPPSHSPQQQSATPEPQKEALDLGMRSSPSSSSPPRQSPPSSSGGSVRIKREMDAPSTSNSAAKRMCVEETEEEEEEVPEERAPPALTNRHIRITSRGDGRDNSLLFSVELNGVVYEGVLFPQTDNRNGNVSTNNNEPKTPSRNVIS